MAGQFWIFSFENLIILDQNNFEILDGISLGNLIRGSSSDLDLFLKVDLLP